MVVKHVDFHPMGSNPQKITNNITQIQVNKGFLICWIYPPPRMPVANEGLGWDSRS